MSNIPVITVDGPSGTGKGTLGRYLADWLQWHFLDSGALYRVLALAAEQQQIALNDESAAERLAQLAENLNVAFQNTEVLLEGVLVTDTIRTEACGNAASAIATLAIVRQSLLDRQRQFQRLPGLVADGRDMATVVFPNATLKLFLTASLEQRVKRRYKQLKEKGVHATVHSLSAQIAERDERDSSRAVSPLKPAEGAIVIDTSRLDIDGVIEKVSELVQHNILDLHQ